MLYFLDKIDSWIFVKKILLFVIIVFVIACPCTAWTADARIDNVKLSVNNGDALVSFSVTDAFNKDIEEAIKSGLATSFTFRVEVNRVNSIWFDANEVDLRFKHTVTYDTLRDEYQVAREEAPDGVVRTNDPAAMQAAMSTCAVAALRPDNGFVKGGNYKIRIKAELRTIKLPMGLDYVLFFVKLWDFETDWHTVTFSP